MVCMADLLSHEELKCTLMTRVLQLALKMRKYLTLIPILIPASYFHRGTTVAQTQDVYS